MYFILVVNAVALASTFRNLAPPSLTIYTPVVLGLICVIRLINWSRRRNMQILPSRAASRLRLLVAMAVLLGFGFSAWGLTLYDYGDPIAKLHVAFFMTVSLFACTMCLTHLRSAAIPLICITIAMLSAKLLSEPYGVSTALAINALLVAVALVAVLTRNYRDFAALVESKQVLAERTSEAVRLVEENHQLAIRDALTGLPNRRWFFSTLARTVDIARQQRLPYPVVAVIDLDGFKPVNDLHGHSAGDRILIEVSDRLREHGNHDVSIARLGGDEFALIFSNVRTTGEADAIGKAVCRHLGEPYRTPEFTAQVNASIGISSIGDTNCPAGMLYEQADYALNYAKRSARGGVTFFTAEHAQEIRDLSLLDQSLRSADLERELYLAYQPIVDGRSGRILAFEALGRWHSPTLGEVPPSVMIATAERSGLINQVTEVLLSQMLHGMDAWPSSIRLSFNLSVHDICSAQTMARIAALVTARGSDAHRIDFEITETSIMHDFDQATSALQILKSLGCGIALDDFGTGHSSLSYVHQLPLDKIKVDRSFVQNITQDPVRLAVTRSIIGLCSNLGLDCVVEGIEEEEQRARIARLGQPMMQGFLFGKPCSQRDAVSMIETAREQALAYLAVDARTVA